MQIKYIYKNDFTINFKYNNNCANNFQKIHAFQINPWKYTTFLKFSGNRKKKKIYIYTPRNILEKILFLLSTHRQRPFSMHRIPMDFSPRKQDSESRDKFTVPKDPTSLPTSKT